LEEEGGLNLYGYVGNSPLGAIDPLGLVDLNKFPDGQGQRDRANNYSESGCFTVAGHGVSFGGKLPVSTGMKGSVISPKTMAGIINRHPNYKKGTPVKAMFCSVGQGGKKSWAQKLANAMGVPVTAPSTLVWWGSDGSVLVADPVDPTDLSKGPNKNKPGTWDTFQPEGSSCGCK
jgi:hypothetical protein